MTCIKLHVCWPVFFWWSPSGWDKHNLSQCNRQIGTGCACPSGTGMLTIPNLSHWDWERSKETCPCPMDRSYTHARGLSLSQDRPYAHDGTCPSPTCPNLSHKVGLQGRGIFHAWREHATFQKSFRIKANFEPVFEPVPCRGRWTWSK